MKQLLCFLAFYMKLLLAWLTLHTICRDLLKKNIWLIREKRDEARDNGFHLYKYIREKHPDINAYYVITPNSPDRHKVEVYGNWIKADSLMHCIYFLAAKKSINSQPYGAYPFPLNQRMQKYCHKLCNREQKVVFLQHGIIKDTLPLNAFLYGACNIDYFVTSTQREYEFIKETYKYPDHAIGCVGLARFDYLHTSHTVHDQILVMPTWRKWLNTDQKAFADSEYFSAYAELLSDPKMVAFLRAHQYKLIFYMHYAMQPFVNEFKAFENDVIIIADKGNYDVQELLMSSKLMITDYSSVYFDFAYMNKPVVYYQFDREQFRQSHYAEGYFSYEEDGFGPCFENLEATRQYIFDLIENRCAQPEKYDLRVQDFFTLRDNHNCERTFNAIMALN